MQQEESSAQSILHKAQLLVEAKRHKEAIQLLGEVIRTPFLDDTITFEARLRRAQAFVSIAKFLRSKAAREGELAPEFGIDLSTWCEMAQSDCEELIRVFNSSSSNGDNMSKLLQQTHIVRAEAAELASDALTARRYIISGLCEFPDCEELQSKLKGLSSSAQQSSDQLKASRVHFIQRKQQQEQEKEDDAESNRLAVTPTDLQLECVICQDIFYQPITLACGHSFCKSCISQTFDHANANRNQENNMFFQAAALGGGMKQHCPLCKTVLHISPDTFPVNLVLEHIAQTLFPAQYRQKRREVEKYLQVRHKQHDDDEEKSSTGENQNHLDPSNESQSSSPLKQNSNNNKPASRRHHTLPLFVCTSTSPGHTVAFNIFEPRYRLMFRRCLRGSREFGLIEHPPQEHSSSLNRNSDNNHIHHKVGTIVKITDSMIQPDGRITITGVSERRMRIISSSELDGYRVGVCEEYDDDEPRSLRDAVSASTGCRLLIARLFEKLGISSSSSSRGGSVPSNPRFNPPPYCHELFAAPLVKAKEAEEQLEKRVERGEEEEDVLTTGDDEDEGGEGEKALSSSAEKSESGKEQEASDDTMVVCPKWVEANFSRVVVPASLWIGEFYYQHSWHNLLLTNTLHRVRHCVSVQERHARGSFLSMLGSSAVQFLRSAVGRALRFTTRSSTTTQEASQEEGNDSSDEEQEQEEEE